MKFKNIFSSIIIHLELFIVAVIVLFPILWIIGSSLGNTTSLASSKLIPNNVTFNNYKRLLTETQYLKWYLNTFKIATFTVIFSVITSMSTSYVFSRFKFRGRKSGLLTILCLQMFPSFLGMTAIYVLFSTAGLLDNIYALVIIYVAGQIPFNTWLMKGYLSNIPMSLDEAAMIDGASKLQIFFIIILPLATPMLTFLAVSSFMAPWMDFIFPRLLLSTDKNKTLAVGLFDFINSNTNTNYTMFAAGAILVALPITLLYISLQKYLISGITAGASKE